MTISTKNILADGRWSGMHGIGRFSTEVLSRLQHTDIIETGPAPLSLRNIVWQIKHLQQHKENHHVFFTPGFNPVLYSPIPYVVTIHDLIHLFAPGNAQLQQKLYYQFFIKPTIKRARYVFTVSEYSKKIISEWANIPADKIINVSCGLSQLLTHHGEKYAPGYPYLLHVGNAEKSHKNIERLLHAFAKTKTDKNLRLIFTGKFSDALHEIARKNHLQNRIVFTNNLSDEELAKIYRGAEAVVFPSLYEGFGLPVLEGMACGVPVLTSNVTSLPEVAGNAAVLTDPSSIDSIAAGIEKILEDTNLRQTLIQRGLQRAPLFSWDKTAQTAQKILDSV